MSQPEGAVAIVGVAGCFAGAADARQLWSNVLAKVDATSEAEAAWSAMSRENDPDTQKRLYTTRGGFLKDLARFDPTEFGIMPRSIDGADPDHYLGLRLARDALRDAGLLDKDFDRTRAGIVLGRGGYAFRGTTTLLQHGLALDQTMAAIAAVRPDFSVDDLREMREALSAQLPAFNAEASPGFVSNVSSGLIANRLDLMGPNYVVDAACASSLLALESAVRELQSDRCDVMLVGGVQVQTGPQIFMVFCNINALSRGRVRPFSKGSSGTLLGEGAGFLVLKRLVDAEANGDRIYAVIRGIGAASDGRAKGLLAPRLEGEELALRRAYSSAQVSPDTIGLIEAHGTGMPLGDRTEIQALTRVFGPRHGLLPSIAIGSIKSMISHCIPASGSASLIKTALALHHKILPPSLCDELDPELELEKTPFYVNTEARPWVHGAAHPRRAGVNAFGFGGINAHVVLEEYRPTRATQVQVLHSPSESELVCLTADSATQLGNSALALAELIPHMPEWTLAGVAKACALRSGEGEVGEHRLAVVAESLSDLSKKLTQAAEKLQRPDPKPFKARGGVFYGAGPLAGRVAFIFPGEGAQYANMLADLALHFPQVRDWFDFLDATALERGAPARSPLLFPAPTSQTAEGQAEVDKQLYEMDVAAESVFAASMALLDVLQSVDLTPDVMLGHSTGENTALTASGVRRFADRSEIAVTVRDLNAIYRELDADRRIVSGSLLTLGALKPELRAQLLSHPPRDIIPAMDNCPNQLVLFGEPSAIAELRQQLATEGVISQELPFGRAYHTALFKPVADAYRKYYEAIDFGPGRVPLYSACSVGRFPEEPAAIRELAAQQWEGRVRFAETVEQLYEDGVRVFIEVGPSGNLTSFVSDVLRDKSDVIAVASNGRRKSGVTQLQQMLAQVWSAGVSLRPQGLFAPRELAAVDLDAEPAPAKRRAVLNLYMPEVRVPEALRKPLPTRPAPAPVVIEKIVQVAAQPSHPNVVSLAIPPQAAPADPRVAAVQAHFGLMQQFLDSQARVLGLSAGASPSALPSSIPALPTQLAPQAATPAIDGLDPAYPLLGRITELSASKLISQRRYDAASELFLQDHAIGGKPSTRQPQLRPLQVMPFTFSMEILSEAAHKLLSVGGESLVVTGLRRVRGHRWLTLDAQSFELRIVAERSATGREVDARLYLQGEKFPPGGLLVFEGTAQLAPAFAAAPTPIEWPADEPGRPAVRHDKVEELYEHGMFHGPRLQCVKSILRWSPGAIECELRAHDVSDFFAFTKTPHLQVDGALLDAAGQMAGYWLVEQYGWDYNCFPFLCEQFTQYGPPPAPGTRLLGRGRIQLIGEMQLQATFDLIREDGSLLLRLEGWNDRRFEVPARYFQFRLKPQERWLTEPVEAAPGVHLVRNAAFAEGFLDAGGEIWKRVLAHMVLGAREREIFNGLSSTGTRREEWLMGRIAAKDAVRHWALARGMALAPADIEILNEDTGRPVVHCAALGAAVPQVSLSHSARGACAAAVEAGAGTHSVGVDLQNLRRVQIDSLLSGAFDDGERQLVESMPAVDKTRVAIALWCAKEAAAKASGQGLGARPQDWRIVLAQLDRRVGDTVARVRHAGVDYEVRLYFSAEDEVMALCAPTPAAPSLLAVAQS